MASPRKKSQRRARKGRRRAPGGKDGPRPAQRPSHQSDPFSFPPEARISFPPGAPIIGLFLTREVKAQRIAEIQNAIDDALYEQLSKMLKPDGPISGPREIRFFLITRGRTPLSPEVNRLVRLVRALKSIVPEVIHFDPFLRKEDLIHAVKTLWPGTRGPRSVTFSPALIRAAHEAVSRESSSKNKPGFIAAQELAHRLGIGIKSIERALTRSRKTKPE